MNDEAGVSPVIGTLLVFAVFTAVTATVIAVARPELVAIQEKGEFDTVTTHMAGVAGEVQRLAIAGDRDELRQPRVVLPRGSFQTQDGHWYGLTVGFLDPDYEDAEDSEVTAWQHPYPVLADGWADDPVNMPVTLRHDNLPLGLNHHWTMERFDRDVGWVTTGSGTSAAWLVGNTVNFKYESSGQRTDTVYRLSIYKDNVVGEDPLFFETYVYQQDRLVYRFEGESGDRELLLENGALFREVRARLDLVTAGLVVTPDPALGSTIYTHRVAHLESTSPIAVSGHSSLGVLMHVDDAYPFDHNRGAVFVRMQVEGPNEAAWRTHLDNEGFTPDATGAEGLYYIDEGNTGMHEAFPFHFIWTDIDLKVRST